MHSPEVLKLLQQVLASPVSSSHLVSEEENTSPKRAATVLDSDDDPGFWGQQVPPDEDLLKQLRFFFPEALVLAALDIVDRDGGRWPVLQSEDREADENAVVVRYTSPLQRVQHQVVGTKRNCCVFPSLPTWTDTGVKKYFCDCPAFTLSVLSAESNFMASVLFRPFGQRVGLTGCDNSANTSWLRIWQKN